MLRTWRNHADHSHPYKDFAEKIARPVLLEPIRRLGPILTRLRIASSCPLSLSVSFDDVNTISSSIFQLFLSYSTVNKWSLMAPTVFVQSLSSRYSMHSLVTDQCRQTLIALSGVLKLFFSRSFRLRELWHKRVGYILIISLLRINYLSNPTKFVKILCIFYFFDWVRWKYILPALNFRHWYDT